MSSYFDDIISRISSTSKKVTIVAEFGSYQTKIGYSGESQPRFILKTEFTLLSGKKLSYEDLLDRLHSTFDENEWKEAIMLFMSKVYYERIMCDPEGTRLLVIENPLAPSVFKRILRDVMTNHYKIHSLIFLPSQPLALIPIELKTGIIVDIGYNETNIVLVVSGSILSHTLQSQLMGRKHILKRMESVLQEYPSYFKNGEYVPLDKSLDPDILDDMCSQFSHFSTHKEEDLKTKTGEYIYTDKNGDIYLLRENIRYCPGEALFKDSSIISVAEMVAEALLKTDLDSRIKLVKKIILIGGGFHSIPGLHKKLIIELKILIHEHKRYHELRGLVDSFNILESLYFDHYMLSWVGASILSSIDNVSLVSSDH